MAKRNQQLTWLLPGTFAACIIMAIILSALGAIAIYAFNTQWQSSLSYIGHLFFFSCYQAFLSALFATIPALIMARVFHRQHFIGKQLLLRFYSMTFFLPSLVVVLGLLTIYGRTGYLATLSGWLGIKYSLSIYGLSGILLAHVFYNFPFALRLFYQTLNHIPSEQYQLSAQLNLSNWQEFKYIEYPLLLRQFLPTFIMIFILCFTGFAIVLTLGGGPKYTTIEVAIYQSIRDFELNQALVLSIIQVTFCLVILFILQKISPYSITLPSYKPQKNYRKLSKIRNISDFLLILLTLFFLLPPLIAIIIDGINVISWSFISNTKLLNAILTSIYVAFFSAVITLILALMLLWSSRQGYLYPQKYRQNLLLLSGMITLAVPSMVLAFGFFLLFRNNVYYPIIVIVSNALMTLPFAVRILENPMNDIAQRYLYLTQSIPLLGLKRLYWIELKALRSTILVAFAFAMVISVADFGVISLFGDNEFMTLPFYLYQQLGAYRNSESTATALLLLLLCFSLFSIIDTLAKHDDQIQ